MNNKKVLVSISLFALLLAAFGFVGAQDTTSTPPPDLAAVRPVQIVRDIVAQQTGLSSAEIIAQIREGSTLAEIVTDNGGDVQTVIDQSVAQLTEAINTAVTNGKLTQERANNLVASLNDVVTRAVNGELFPNRLDAAVVRRREQAILLQAVVDETSLSNQQVLEQLSQGKTLADVITANNGSVEDVVAFAVASATDQINAAVTDGRLGQQQSDRLIASLEIRFSNAVNGEFRERAGKVLVSAAVIRLAAEQTGMTAAEIRQAIRSGSTLGQVLTEHGVDISAFVDAAVAQAQERLGKAVINGRLTQEQADQRIAQLRERLTERLNSSDTPETTSAA